MITPLIHTNGMGDTFITSEAEMDARCEGDEWDWRDDDVNPTVVITTDWVAESLDISAEVAQRIVDTLTRQQQNEGFFEVTKKQWGLLVDEHSIEEADGAEEDAEEAAPTLRKLRNAPQPLDEDAEDDAREIGDSPRRPTAGTTIIFVQGETEGSGERRREMTIEAADFAASEIMGEETQMRFFEDVYVAGAAPHTMRGFYIWIEESAEVAAAADDE